MANAKQSGRCALCMQGYRFVERDEREASRIHQGVVHGIGKDEHHCQGQQ